MATVNGVLVTDARVVEWKQDDDAEVKARCDARGLVLFDGGGKSDAIVVNGRAIIWERQGERFRAFAVAPRPASLADELRWLTEHMRGVALRVGHHAISSVLLSQVGALNALAGMVRS